MGKKFYIGLDMGTDSLGWAVTDEDYNLLKARGKDFWGSYLFDEAESKENRRINRASRRRIARTHYRLVLLQELFASAVAKVDRAFFIRLKNSSLYAEDKDSVLTSRDSLFADSGFDDKDFYKQYPTIFHLRSALISGEVRDVRLLYLAVHHIIKNRGHFLFETQTFKAGDESAVKEKFGELNNYLSEREFSTFTLENIEDVLSVLKDKRANKKSKVKQLKELFEAEDKQQLAIINAITGATAKTKDLFDLEEEPDYAKLCFDGFDDSTEMPKIESSLGMDEAEFINILKSIYDWSVLCNIMGDSKFISEAKVKQYEKHKSDLLRLKEFVKVNCPERYKEVFRHKKDTDNYAAYIGMDRQKGFSKCSKDKFYAFLKNKLKVDESILSDIDRGDFMPKPISNANSVIPYQVHYGELEAILKNAEKYFPFLLEVSDGMTVSQKILSLMKFRIPYYVGPLNNAGELAWVVKKEGQERTRITPWNFDSVVDRDLSENEFIRRMTNQCTYLRGENVLPANSLLYSEFTFLNELNNLRINNKQDDKARSLIYEYAKTHKKVTLKKCLGLLVQNGIAENGSTVDIFSGTDGDFKSSLAPYVDFAFLGDKLYTHSEMCEEIIEWITIVTDKDRLEKRIRQKYGDILTNDEIKKIKGFNYNGWGRLSKAFLTEIKCVSCADESGEPYSIIDAMRVKGKNLMQLLSVEYGYLDAIDEFNSANGMGEKLNYNYVDKLYCSPQVKRSIWRAVEIVREIVKIKGKPEKIFIEFARENNNDDKKARTVSRKQQLIDLYRNIKDEERDWIDEIESESDSSKFNSDKLVLYYRQMGRCAYSGESIPLSDVFNTNICDIDHIYPQSKIKDDSLDNRVLVYKTENMKKGDNYPITSEVRKTMYLTWLYWKNKGLISEKKFYRLTRDTALTQEELADFINRQLVSTRQSTKATAEILKKMLPDTEIVYAKAANANDFKQENNIVKIRDLNDLHHAKDAYINIVVGNVYNTKFNHNAAVFFRKNDIDSYNFKYLFKKDVPGAWKVSDLERIISIVSKNTMRVVHMTEKGKGKLFDATIKTKGANDRLIPLKEKGAISNTAKYGGYDSPTTTYFLLVKSKGKKGKTMLSLEPYPLYRDLRYKGSNEDKLSFCRDNGLIDPEILIDELKINTLIYLDGSYAYLRGKSNEKIVLCNANELFLDDCSMSTLKLITKYFSDIKKYNNKELRVNKNITEENTLKLYDVLVEKLDSEVYKGLNIKGQVPFLKESRDSFISLTLEERCKVIIEVLHLMQCNSTPSDFTLIGGKPTVGKVTINKFIQDKNVKIIYQSPTGYYRKVIDVKKYL